MANSFVQHTIQLLNSESEPDMERHTRFTETQVGALVCHDYERRQYCRIYQSEVDLDIIRRFVDRNLCSPYPDVTVRYFAQNWPELCIITFTDTHIPIGLIIGQQAESQVGRIAFLAVEKRVEAELIYKRLLQLELEKMHATGIRQVLLKPLDERTRKKLLRYMGNASLRYVNQNGEFQFHV
ncbi:N-acetyltransferase mak3 [Paragonimus westermani]|uniref:N-acetyltransferase mak3 n=1 Tax=Paragonimus westermani TaxID=34504 RepID=A0A8T0D4S2_9TREM|nr:N-acetyltransferase mak3 [Paragonimus westermani]